MWIEQMVKGKRYTCLYTHTHYTHKHPQAYKRTHAIILHIIKENTHAKSWGYYFRIWILVMWGFSDANKINS